MMVEKDEFQNNPEVAAALNQVVTLLQNNPLIQEYKEITKKVEAHPSLFDLTESIKVAQKEAVRFAHYGKPEAEKVALKEAQRLTTLFDQHPLVIRYREVLTETNDLLQYLTKKFEREFNDTLELKLSDVLMTEKQGKEPL